MVFVTQIPLSSLLASLTTRTLRRDGAPVVRWLGRQERKCLTATRSQRPTAQPHIDECAAATDAGHHEKVCCFRPTTFSSSIQCFHRRPNPQRESNLVFENVVGIPGKHSVQEPITSLCSATRSRLPYQRANSIVRRLPEFASQWPGRGPICAMSDATISAHSLSAVGAEALKDDLGRKPNVSRHFLEDCGRNLRDLLRNASSAVCHAEESCSL